jgi:hypothetical protein
MSSTIPQISRSSNTDRFKNFKNNVNRKTKKKIEAYEKSVTIVKECDSKPDCSRISQKNKKTKKKEYTSETTAIQKKNKENKAEKLLKVLYKLSKYYRKKLIKTLSNITSKSIFGNYKKLDNNDIDNVKKYLMILKDIYSQTECISTKKIKSDYDIEALLKENKYSPELSRVVLTNLLSTKPDLAILQPNIDFFITLKNIIENLDPCKK